MPNTERPNNFSRGGKELKNKLPDSYRTDISELDAGSPITPDLNGELLIRIKH